MTTLWVSGGVASGGLTGGTTVYQAVANAGFSAQNATEANVQTKMLSAGTFSNFTFETPTNTTTGASTVTLRIGAAAGNEVLSVTAGTTGIFTDAVHTDIIALNALLDEQIVVGTGTALAEGWSSINFTPASGDYIKYSSFQQSLAAASTTSYMPLMGGNTTSTTAETNIPITMRGTGTLGNVTVNAPVNARTSASTVRSRISGANGNVAVSITATTTGQFQDLINTDAITSGLTVNTSLTTGTGGGTIASTTSASYVPTGPAPMAWFVPTGVALAAAATRYYALCGNANGQSVTAAPVNITLGTAASFSRLLCNVSVSAGSTGALTGAMLRNNLPQGGAFSVAAGTTGYFEDATHTDYYATSDGASYQMANGTNGSVTLTAVGAHMNAGATAPPGSGGRRTTVIP